MTGDGERTKEAWLRVGGMLKRRRPEIDPRYRVRKRFAEANGLPDKTVQEIENGYRTSFRETTMAAFDKAYQLAPGSIDQALDTPTMTEFPNKLGPTEPATPTQPTDDVAFPPVQLTHPADTEDFDEPWAAHIWRTPGLSAEDRRHLIDYQRSRSRNQPKD